MPIYNTGGVDGRRHSDASRQRCELQAAELRGCVPEHSLSRHRQPPRPPGWAPQLVMLPFNTIVNCVLITRIGAHEGDGDGTLANAWTTGANPAPGGCVSGPTLRGATMLAWLAASVPALAQDNVVATATLPRDLSPWGMYLNADPVVKAVLIGLAFASIVTWTVWLAKTIEIVLAKRRVRAALNKLVRVRSTAEGVE